MKKRLLLMLIMLAVLSLFCGPAVAIGLADSFADVGNHWAKNDIKTCQEYQLMSGYPDNLFLPDRYLSRAEALAVIGKGLGWEKQAGPVSAEAISFPADLWEGFRKYVTYAADKQLIPKAEIAALKFNEPATRLEVVVWLAKTLNLKGSGDKLVFTDLAGVTPPQLDLLAGVVEAGIIKGSPDNMFNPSGSLSRAGMAAILARLIEKGKITPPSGRPTDGLTGQKGYVINKYHDYFTVHLGLGQVEKVSAAGLSLRIDDVPTAYGSVQRGRPVELFKTGNAVTVARILDGTPRAFGRINRVTSGAIVIDDEEGNAVVYDVSKRARVVDENGGQIQLTGGETGAGVELLLDYQNNIVQIILNKSIGRNVEGRIDDIDILQNKSVSIVSSGVRLTYFFTDNVAVRGEGGIIPLSELKEGMDVRMALDAKDRVISVDLAGPPTIEGKVLDISAVRDQINITDRKGLQKIYLLEGGLTVMDGSTALSLSDIKEDMDVRLTLNSRGRVVSIEIVDISTVVGHISGIRNGVDSWILLKSSSGREEAYYVSNGVIVREGDNALAWDSVKEGMRVKLTLDVVGSVVRIDVTGVQTMPGQVVNFQNWGSRKITIRDSSARDRTYNLGGSVLIKKGDRTLGFGEIKEGMNIKIVLGDDGRVLEIENEDLTVVEGVLASIKKSGLNKIVIMKEDGSQEAYYLPGGIMVREEGVTKSVIDLAKGMRVKLTINPRGNPTLLEVTGKVAVEGKVTGYSTRETDKIKISRDNGQEEVYYFEESAFAREGDSGFDLDGFYEGMRVRLIVDGSGLVTRIDVLGVYTIRGLITQFRPSNDNTATIKGEDGREKTYSIDSGATVSRDGSALSLGDVRRGMYAELTLDRGLNVCHININRDF